MQAELITAFADLEGLRPDWDRLWQEDPLATCFSRFSWMRAMWRAYGRRRQVCTPVIRDGPDVVGILPLALEDDRLVFLGDPRSDYNDLLCRPGRAREVARAAFDVLARSNRPWQQAVLANIPEQSNLAPFIHDLGDWTRRPAFIASTAACPRVDLTENGAAILQGILRKKSLLRHEKDLARLGTLTFRHLTDRDEVRRVLPEYFRQHVARRAVAGGESLFREEEARAFYEAVVDECDPRDELRFAVVELDGRPVACHLGFEARGVLVWYKPTFDVDLWDRSPGEVLLKRLFEYVRDQSLQTFDFTVGDEAFKARFANCVRRNRTVILPPAGWRGRLIRSRHAALAAVRAWAAECPPLRDAMTEIRAALDRVEEVGGGARARLRAVSRSLRERFLGARATRFLFASTVQSPEPGPNPANLGLRPMSLGELTRHAESEPTLPLGAILRAARAAQRHDHQLLAITEGDRLHGLAIAGKAAELVLPASAHAPGATIRLPTETFLVSQMWLVGHASEDGAPALLGQALAGHARALGLDCWVSCERSQRGLGNALASAGFRYRGRVTQVRLLGVAEWTWSTL